MFKCAECYYQFSVTSGTSLSYHKLDFRDMLHMICLYTQGAKGVAALQMSRMAGRTYMTAFVFDHKLREGLLRLQNAQRLDGIVEADSAYFGNKVRVSNRVGENGKRSVRRRSKKWSAVVARSRDGGVMMWPATETQAIPLIKAQVLRSATIITDRSQAFNDIGFFYQHHTIDHSKVYAENGISTNLAESAWSRVRRGMIGVFHKMGEPYRDAYFAEFGFREAHGGNRGNAKGNGEQFLMIAAAALHSPKSERWTGYWQRRRVAE